MINGIAYDHQNITIAAGDDEIDIMEINYSDSVSSEKLYGSGREAVDSTDGVYEVEEVTMTLAEHAYRNLIERLGPGFMRKRARFDISVTYSHEGEPTVTDTLERCRITGNGASSSQGGEPVQKDVTIECMKILWNGIDPMAEA